MAGCLLKEIEDVRRELTVARTEIKNIRQKMFTMKKKQEKEMVDIKKIIQGPLPTLGSSREARTQPADRKDCSGLAVRPIAYMESVFCSKNGTPRQSGVCAEARGRLTLLKTVFTNPEHSLEGLEQFSHIWILFIFHDNGPGGYHAKVRPPRMGGSRLGVFSTRSPHRPSPIGLTLAKLERIEGATLHVSGIDIIDGTPIIDIKPYIPQYDLRITEPRFQSHSLVDDRSPNERNIDQSSAAEPRIDNHPMNDQCSTRQPITDQYSSRQPINDQYFTEEPINVPDTKTDKLDVLSETKAEVIGCSQSQIADWIATPTLSKACFTPRALEGIAKFSSDSENPLLKLNFLRNWAELKDAIISVLSADPRSIYRREKCQDRLYYFTVDVAHVTVWFDGDMAEVLRVQPWTRLHN